MIQVEEGKPDEEAFLVEMRSLSGFSGSPVVWRLPITFEYYLAELGKRNNQPYPLSSRNMSPDSGPLLTGPLLVGIECGSFPFYYPVVHKGTDISVEDYEAKSHSGVAIVVPAWKLEELLNDEELIMARKKVDEEITEMKHRRRSNVDREVALPDGPLTETGFDDILKRVSQKTTDPSEPESEKKPNGLG